MRSESYYEAFFGPWPSFFERSHFANTLSPSATDAALWIGTNTSALAEACTFAGNAVDAALSPGATLFTDSPASALTTVQLSGDAGGAPGEVLPLEEYASDDYCDDGQNSDAHDCDASSDYCDYGLSPDRHDCDYGPPPPVSGFTPPPPVRRLPRLAICCLCVFIAPCVRSQCPS